MSAESAETTEPSGEMPERTEIDRIVDLPQGPVALESGFQVEILPLKTRQFFKMLRIVTRGGAQVMGGFNLSMDQTEEEFTNNLIAVLIFALPEADDEAIEFLASCIRPAGLKGNKKVDADAWAELAAQMENPTLDDTVTIIEAVLRREAPELKALGKRLRGMFEMAQKAGQIPTSPQKMPALSEVSAEPSISSAASTGGQTSES